MDNKPSKKPRYMGNAYYKIIIFLAAVTAAVYKIWWFAICLIAALIFISIFGAVSDVLGVRKMREHFNKILSNSEGDATNLPFALAVLNSKGKITWYNKELGRVFGGELLFQKDISSICKGFDIKKVIENGKDEPFRTNVGDKVYDIWAHLAFSAGQDSSPSVFAYFIDVTDHVEKEKIYAGEKPVVAVAVFDNYDEVMQNADEESKARISSRVDRTMASFGAEINAIYKKLDRGRYFLAMYKKDLDELTAKKFEILAKIREITADTASGISPTMSIGIGSGGETLSECDAFARAALDMALGRGGDQVVIKDSEKFKYYGGKTREFEKSARVKARVIAGALLELIRQSDKVVVMGHKNSDIDALGAAVGIMAAAHANGKKAYMVASNYDSAVDKTIDALGEIKEYQSAFLKADEAREIWTAKTLLVVVDTHTVSYVSNPELLSLSEQTVVIDHHRRGADFIENYVLLYHEPYASSASEMVTEMLQYMGGRIKLTRTEAEAIYAGIYLDTKGFKFKTGVRTLEAAATLRRAGADTAGVNKLFQTDFDEVRTRYEIISSAEIVRDKVAIASTEKKVSGALIARAADEMLSVSQIEISFVLAPNGRGCTISGRSMGDVNVQVVLEKLGGGGHLTVAGAQLEGKSVSEGIALLKGALDEYFKEQ